MQCQKRWLWQRDLVLYGALDKVQLHQDCQFAKQAKKKHQVRQMKEVVQQRPAAKQQLYES